MTTATPKTAAKSQKNPTLPSPALSGVEGRIQMEREMMIMRETDQWMVEHYKRKA